MKSGEYMMDAKERLQNVRTELEKRGTRDVKFLFLNDAKGRMPSALKSDVADVMEKYLNNQKTLIKDFSDEVLPA